MEESRRVLLVVEDETLSELLGEALRDAGHRTAHANDASLEIMLDGQPFDAVIVDVDTRARNGAHVVARIRRAAPASTVVALLPCGGIPAGASAVPYHLAIEKPARLAAVLSAVHAARRAP